MRHQTWDGSVNAVVFEARSSAGGKSADHIDQDTIGRLRRSGTIPENMQTIAVSPATEPVLWSADLFAWGTNRHLSQDDSRWLEDSAAPMQWIDAQTQHQLREPLPRFRGSDPDLSMPSIMAEDGPRATATRAEVLDGTGAHRVGRAPVSSQSLQEMINEIRAQKPTAGHVNDLEVGRGGLSLQQQKASPLPSTQARQQAQREQANQQQTRSRGRERPQDPDQSIHRGGPQK